jgi:hypothetical protein
MRSFKDLWFGIIRHPFRTLTEAFVAFSVLWTLTEALSYFVAGFDLKGRFWLSTFALMSLCWALKRAWKPSKVEFRVATCDTTLEIVFGDIFGQDGIRAIAVSEFFDSQIGKPVSDKSLHGIFLKRCFGGHPEAFDKQVNSELKNVPGAVVSKTEGKSRSYPIGTTAIIIVNGDVYLALAFAKADPQSCKAYSDVSMMWQALHCLWQRARTETGGHPINVPLVGSGLSGLGLPSRDLLNLIILSAITETKSKQITSRIRIVLHRDRFEELDLREVKRHWEE